MAQIASILVFFGVSSGENLCDMECNGSENTSQAIPFFVNGRSVIRSWTQGTPEVIAFVTMAVLAVMTPCISVTGIPTGRIPGP